MFTIPCSELFLQQILQIQIHTHTPRRSVCVCVYVCMCVCVSFSFFLGCTHSIWRSAGQGSMGAIAASLHHSHSNTRSKLHLQPIPQFKATPDPLPTEQGQGSNLRPHGYQQNSFPLSHNGNSQEEVFRDLTSSTKMKNYISRFIKITSLSRKLKHFFPSSQLSKKFNAIKFIFKNVPIIKQKLTS